MLRFKKVLFALPWQPTCYTKYTILCLQGQEKIIAVDLGENI